MKTRNASLILGVVGASALLGAFLWKRYGQAKPQQAKQKESIVRWEGEGGNVPDVAVGQAVQPNYEEVAALRA